MCAMFYIIENGCKYEALSKEYGKWHKVYMKFNGWFKNGAITRILAAMRKRKLFNEKNSMSLAKANSFRTKKF